MKQKKQLIRFRKTKVVGRPVTLEFETKKGEKIYIKATKFIDLLDKRIPLKLSNKK